MASKNNNSKSVIFDFIRSQIADMDWAELDDLAKAAGMTTPALFFWQQGIVESPLLANAEAVLEALGFSVEFDGFLTITISEPASLG